MALCRTVITVSLAPRCCRILYRAHHHRSAPERETKLEQEVSTRGSQTNDSPATAGSQHAGKDPFKEKVKVHPREQGIRSARENWWSG